MRARRGNWLPSNWNGNYRLPIRLAARLKADLAEFRNRDAAYALFVLLARHHAAPRTIGRGLHTGFAVDRRALSNSSKSSLTENQVRGAIQKLVRVGAVETIHASESLRQPGKHNNPQSYRFVGDYAKMLADSASKSRRFSKGSADGRKHSSSFSKSPKDSRDREAGLHSGDLMMGQATHQTRRVRMSGRELLLREGHGLRQPARAWTAPVSVSDEVVWSVIDQDLQRGLRGRTQAYWQVFSHLTPEIQKSAVSAERACKGQGLVTLHLELLKRKS